MNKAPLLSVMLLALLACASARSEDLLGRVKHGYADSAGVKIHYATLGQGPLVVMIHGFPDFWYTWRRQMEGLSDQFQVVAVDLRGYNDSDKPKGVENYALPVLAGDILAEGREGRSELRQEAYHRHRCSHQF